MQKSGSKTEEVVLDIEPAKRLGLVEDIPRLENEKREAEEKVKEVKVRTQGLTSVKFDWLLGSLFWQKRRNARDTWSSHDRCRLSVSCCTSSKRPAALVTDTVLTQRLLRASERKRQQDSDPEASSKPSALQHSGCMPDVESARLDSVFDDSRSRHS